MLKPLPIGIATFRDVIEGGYRYIDKTRYIYELVKEFKGVYFLSRPRRFGKSLMVSTLDELFHGNRELFKGLWIDSQTDYAWSVHPVIRLDFGAIQVSTVDELQQFIDFELQRIALENQVELRGYNPQSRFRDLIRQLASTHKVVILVDEYDKAILDNINNLEEVEQIRRFLKGFYGVIKAMDAFVRFVFLTGISKFSKVSVFSDLNNLYDLTLQTPMATALGWTEAEIQADLHEYLVAFAENQGTTTDALVDKIRNWYDGFCFAPEAENVYNPFSTLLLFKTQRFANHWFETGTPTFLINLIYRGNYDIEQFDRLEVSELAFSTYDLQRLAIVPLLVQSGYLTIKSYDKTTQFYTLSYPNYEVQNAFMVYLLDAFSNTEQGLSESYIQKLVNALQKHDLAKFFEILKVLYANIDYDLHVNHEKYYQTIFYLTFKLIGLRIDAEVKTNAGRIDAVVELKDRIYLFEFKLNQNAEVALQQITEKDYYRKYQLHGKAMTLVGANFDSNQHLVTDWKSAEL